MARARDGASDDCHGGFATRHDDHPCMAEIPTRTRTRIHQGSLPFCLQYAVYLAEPVSENVISGLIYLGTEAHVTL